ncbi:ATP-binding protein [Marinoscillum furvescens]|uniref:Serine/threonine-protein kinase RsbW n=1 Tax=Marinoscillum furvescens DSM 4134 TaxID=1122208 RepID=A0A3D9L608_MARFU|nr:ATP-binding protein [Marinoscillum furvescens]REE01618.1 serine/threonine-protein kinase RsbW [Marinoscillum furvescens DSM 4134]
MKHKLTIACSKANLTKIRQFISESLGEVNLNEVETHKMILAVDEICANMIIHSNHCNPTRKIDVIVEAEPANQVIFIIKDRGIRFDFNTYSEPSMDEIISSKRKGGVGLMLVKRIMDKIEFSTDKNYNICRLTKRLSP